MHDIRHAPFTRLWLYRMGVGAASYSLSLQQHPCVAAAGCCKSDGQVADTQPPRCHEDVWPQIGVASRLSPPGGRSRHALALPRGGGSCTCTVPVPVRLHPTTDVHAMALAHRPHCLAACVRVQTLKSTQAMADAMRGATKVTPSLAVCTRVLVACRACPRASCGFRWAAIPTSADDAHGCMQHAHRLGRCTR